MRIVRELAASGVGLLADTDSFRVKATVLQPSPSQDHPCYGPQF
jgi:hypothetical protein